MVYMYLYACISTCVQICAFTYTQREEGSARHTLPPLSPYPSEARFFFECGTLVSAKLDVRKPQ